jgi:hypothetical protein
MKHGWYVHCPDCGVVMFVSRWKWWALYLVRKGLLEPLPSNGCFSYSELVKK